MARLATGISGFDAMVQGGLPAGSSVVLQGPPGQEKLRFALTFLAEGLKSGGRGLVVVSRQSPDALLAPLRALGAARHAHTPETPLGSGAGLPERGKTTLDLKETHSDPRPS